MKKILFFLPFIVSLHAMDKDSRARKQMIFEHASRILEPRGCSDRYTVVRAGTLPEKCADTYIWGKPGFYAGADLGEGGPISLQGICGENAGSFRNENSTLFAYLDKEGCLRIGYPDYREGFILTRRIPMPDSIKNQPGECELRVHHGTILIKDSTGDIKSFSFEQN